ncbi:MAG: NAD(P)H-binding protein [Chitinophagales bacterium]|nr:NAD(P)H-binding protein [Chitinophagales bacterium]
MKVCMIGATGATGKDLLELLLDHEAIETVHVFVRKALALRHHKLYIHEVDFDQPDSWISLITGDVAISCMGTTLKQAGSKEAQWKVDFNYQNEFANHAKQNGIPVFILLSASGANPNSSVFYSKMKGQLEVAIQQIGFQSLIVVRPGLLDRKNSDRKNERYAVAMVHFFNSFGLFKKFRPLPTKELAEAMLQSIFDTRVSYRVIKLP